MGRKKREFNRLRLDSGQHRRIMLVSALLGALAFSRPPYRPPCFMISGSSRLSSSTVGTTMP